MKIAHLGDLHISEGARLSDQAATLGSIVDAIGGASPDLILIAGDLYGRTVPHRSTPMERSVLIPAVSRMASIAPVIVIYGNHDSDPDLDILVQIGGAHPVRVIKNPTVIEVPTRSGVAHLYCLPYPSRRALLGDDAPRGMAEVQSAMADRVTALLTMWARRIRRVRGTEAAIGALTAPSAHVGLMHVQVSGSRTSGGEVLAGNEIEIGRLDLDAVPFDYVALGHLHMRQEVALRAWFPGSPWRNDHAEIDAKGWHLVNILPDGVGPHTAGDATYALTLEAGAGGRSVVSRLACVVTHHPSPCRDFVTLDYRWGERDGAVTWIRRPDDAAIEDCRGAEVRMRLVVSEAHIGWCPWQGELVRVESIAHRVQEERKVEPVIRVRAPAVAEAATDEAKMRAFFEVLATPPTPTGIAGAVDALRELATTDDDAIGVVTAAVVSHSESTAGSA